MGKSWLPRKAVPSTKPAANDLRREMQLLAYARDADVRSLFELLGMVAKADGSVTIPEIREIESFMSAHVLDGQIALAKESFRNGKALQADHATVTRRAFDLYGFREESGPERWLEPLQILDILLRVAFADGEFAGNERVIIEDVRKTLGAHTRSYWILRDTVAERFGVAPEPGSFVFKTRQEANATESKVKSFIKSNLLTKDEALGRLGLNARSSANEIKAKYRELVKGCHPDLMMNKGTEDEIRAAAIKFCELQEAYEALTKIS